MTDNVDLKISGFSIHYRRPFEKMDQALEFDIKPIYLHKSLCTYKNPFQNN